MADYVRRRLFGTTSAKHPLATGNEFETVPLDGSAPSDEKSGYLSDDSLVELDEKKPSKWRRLLFTGFFFEMAMRCVDVWQVAWARSGTQALRARDDTPTFCLQWPFYIALGAKRYRAAYAASLKVMAVCAVITGVITGAYVVWGTFSCRECRECMRQLHDECAHVMKTPGTNDYVMCLPSGVILRNPRVTGYPSDSKMIHVKEIYRASKCPGTVYAVQSFDKIQVDYADAWTGRFFVSAPFSGGDAFCIQKNVRERSIAVHCGHDTPHVTTKADLAYSRTDMMLVK